MKKQGAKKEPLPVVRVRTRDIGPKTRLLLYVAAGGRCEFDGCNRELLEHHVTHARGNYGELAHICAFSPRGPRGRKGSAPKLNDASNLMLFCPACHKRVDGSPHEFPISVLKKYKTAHEDRIRLLTGTAPDRQTTAILLRGKIDGQIVEILHEHLQEAVAPNYIDPRDVVDVDLTGIDDQHAEAFWITAGRTIAERVSERFNRNMPSPVTRVSVFALAPIPLLIYLGSRLSNKTPVTLYQRHRDTESWAWKSTGEVITFRHRRIREGTDPASVALILSLSGTILVERLPGEIDDRFSVDEITLDREEPGFLFLNVAETLWQFRKTYFAYLETLTREHPNLRDLHLFPAVPAPVAVACGLDLLAKPHCRLLVYDLRRRGGGFDLAMRVERDDRE
jgi:hypothetical protein